MKTIAFYLPQFHNVEENNKWWGEGYTDWVAMKCAQPLYEGHMQPKIPLNNNLYDLEKKETMQWQATLMKKYNIYGMAMYHYWFKEGRKILERPAENLLNWKDIDMPFCFYWANEPWIRSWSNIEGGLAWINQSRKRTEVEKDNGVLMEQDYGDEKDWTDHFEYFEKFFRDKRYIKIDDKPVIMIYHPDMIPCLEKMLECWSELAVQRGYEGVYLIGANCNDGSARLFDMQLMHEPAVVLARDFTGLYRERNEVARYISYDKFWGKILSYKSLYANPSYGGVVNFDTTPRRGNEGTVIYNGTAEKFKIYLTELYAKNAAIGMEYTFINAWNEWGEGMYLEPDETEGYGYLEAIEYANRHYQDEMYKYMQADDSELQKLENEVESLKIERRLLNKWIKLKQNSFDLSKAILDNGYKKICIYGYGILGKLLIGELRHSDVKIECIIDIRADNLSLDIPTKKPTEIITDCDAIIISNIHIYEKLKEQLSVNFKGDIVSLCDVIDDAYNKIQ